MAADPKKPAPTAWFRLKAGIAVVPDLSAPYDPTPDPKTGVVPRRPSRQLKAGDRFEAAGDFVARHGAEKFERIATPRLGRDGRVEADSPTAYDTDGTPLGDARRPVDAPTVTASVTAPLPDEEPAADPQVQGDDEPDYGAMSVQQLKQYAADNEIDVGRAHTKAELVKAIRKARG